MGASPNFKKRFACQHRAATLDPLLFVHDAKPATALDCHT